MAAKHLKPQPSATSHNLEYCKRKVPAAACGTSSPIRGDLLVRWYSHRLLQRLQPLDDLTDHRFRDVPALLGMDRKGSSSRNGPHRLGSERSNEYDGEYHEHQQRDVYGHKGQCCRQKQK